jgi:hypothetical protein
MNRPRGFALGAGIIYLEFSLFAAAALWLWTEHTTLERFLATLPSTPGAIQLFSVICVLLLSSLILGVWLTTRRRANKVALIAGAVIVVTGFWWNVFVMVSLIVPLGLRGSRIERKMPANNALLSDAFRSLRFACGAANRGR